MFIALPKNLTHLSVINTEPLFSWVTHLNHCTMLHLNVAAPRLAGKFYNVSTGLYQVRERENTSISWECLVREASTMNRASKFLSQTTKKFCPVYRQCLFKMLDNVELDDKDYHIILSLHNLPSNINQTPKKNDKIGWNQLRRAPKFCQGYKCFKPVLWVHLPKSGRCRRWSICQQCPHQQQRIRWWHCLDWQQERRPPETMLIISEPRRMRDPWVLS